MTKIVFIMLSAGTLAFAQTAATKTAAKPAVTAKAPVKRAAAVETITLPAAAKQVGDGVWEHTDAAGKQWVYKKMPFGLTRFDKTEFQARYAGSNSVPPEMTVEDRNGTYEFTRRTPFGGVKYSKKLDDMNETERAVLAAHERKIAAAKN